MKNYKQKIAWITADYFIDVDIDIINSISNNYIIDWYVVLPKENSRYSKSTIKEKITQKDIKITEYVNKYRFRNFKNIFLYFKILHNIKKNKPDIVYINMQGYPYLALISFILLKKKNTIFTVHQAKVHYGMNYKLLTSVYFKLLYSYYSNFHLYSKTQLEIFKKEHPNKNCYLIPLAMKDFGKSNSLPPSNEIIFLNFGNIIKSKNIECLIKAACNIYEKGFRGFRVKIVGNCNNWQQYLQHIKYNQIFDLRIESILNEEIPDLFSSSHYLVLPYSAVSQSGPLKIAYKYNIPIIASDLQEFKNEIIDNKTGYLFKSCDVSSLEAVMINAIISHNANYKNLKRNLLEITNTRYSFEKINSDYCQMFNKINS